MLSTLFSLIFCSTFSHAWLPNFEVRGVNLGSHFLAEPWMMNDEWNSMGCGNYLSEFECVRHIGQSAANTAFQRHWDTWTTQQDIAQMKSYGLNTIRIPVGYWLREDLVYADSEHFPQGGLQYLDRLCGWASDAGMYIIIDLHGAPGAQIAGNPDTGQVSILQELAISTSKDENSKERILSSLTDYPSLTDCSISRVLCRLSVRKSLQIPGMDDKHYPHQQQLPQRRHARSCQ